MGDAEGYGENLLAATIIRRRILLQIFGVTLGSAVFGMAGAEAALASPLTLWPNGTAAMPTVTSPFGPRDGRLHAGVDFVGFSTVRAVSAGTVIASGVLSGWSAGGWQVYIQHDGYRSRSLHLQAGSPISAGSVVSAGTPIGLMGNTGNSFGTHLHLEVDAGVGQIDPVPFLRSRISATTQQPTSNGVYEDMPIHVRRQSNNAAYTIIPAKMIKHVPSTADENIAIYTSYPGDQFKGLNETDMSIALWDLGFPEVGSNMSLLPLNGAYYWSPAR